MKNDKTKPMSNRQARQLEGLGVSFDREMTVHQANRLANAAIVAREKASEVTTVPLDEDTRAFFELAKILLPDDRRAQLEWHHYPRWAVSVHQKAGDEDQSGDTR
jgi:hypothetical protein